MLVLIGIGLFANIALGEWVRRSGAVTDRVLSSVMAADALILTALLALSGGPFNPFSTLYLVNVALGAVLLTPRGCWTQLALSLAAFGALFPLQHVRPEGLRLPDHGDMMKLHVGGMWVAFAVSALLIVSFVLRVKRALAERDLELVSTRALQARQERMASLGALAAGAAHELATPLSTIAVVARELETSLSQVALSDDAREDLKLVRDQVERCRNILGQMSADLGHSMGEPLQPVSLGQWASAALETLPDTDRQSILLEGAAALAQVKGPPRALTDALRRLLKNAQQASPSGSPVQIELGQAGAQAWIAVTDRGVGMDESLLSRVGEPFFTTKPPGEGMGLGLFITRTLMEQLGGELTLDSRPGHGTTARLQLPLASAS
jgi:two-component system sensor histidine kinase RegB